jgi:hypothetical protein
MKAGKVAMLCQILSFLIATDERKGHGKGGLTLLGVQSAHCEEGETAMQGTAVPHVPAGVCPSLESLGMRGELLWRLIRFPRRLSPTKQALPFSAQVFIARTKPDGGFL